MIINGRRALAYIAKIDSITPLENYDRVEYAHIGGWGIVVSKSDGFQPGDLCVYIETDSRVPADDERFAFLEKYNYRIKIQKICRVYSQGLILPLSRFPELAECKEGDDVTEALRITYYEKGGNARKADIPETTKAVPPSRLSRIKGSRFIKPLMKHTATRRVVFLLTGETRRRKGEKKELFPTQFSYVYKTNEERIENMPYMLDYGNPLTVTEKIDGTSATYLLERKHGHYEYYVCSRNRRLYSRDIDRGCYWEMSDRYDIRAHLEEYLKAHPGLKFVCIQGEIAGPGIQSNPLQLEERHLYVFNFIRADIGRAPAESGAAIVRNWGMEWVPILSTHYMMPGDMEEFKQYADGVSAVNPDVIREGVVLRDQSCGVSFKNVSRQYQMRHS